MPNRPLADRWNLIGMLDHKGGIGNAARSNIEAMKMLTHWPRVIPFPSARFRKAGQVYAVRGKSYLHFNPACVPITDLRGRAWFKGTNIGFWAWETTEPPAAWKEYDRHMAQIWVPSHFVQEALVKAGFRAPVHVIPHAIEQQSRHIFEPDGPITFLVQFDGESRFARKRPDLALKAITAAALKSGEKVRIIIKRHNHRDASELHFAEYPNIEIEVFDNWLSDFEMEALWSRVDVLVSMNRGEGFGLPLVEAMARGIAVVATCWAGSTDYMTPDNSYPVNVARLEDAALAGDGYFKTGQWAMPDTTDAKEQIIRCMADIRSGRITALADQARQTADEFTMDKMITRMKTALTDL